MVFLGDIAHPFTNPPSWCNKNWPWPSSMKAIINLEGAIVASEVESELKRRRLFNHISIIEALKSLNVCAVTLANNHIMDIPGALVFTEEFLNVNGISSVGAGSNLAKSILPVIVDEKGKAFLLIGVGWETIQCIAAGKKKAGIHPFHPKELLKLVMSYRRKYPRVTIVVMPHWNYELELYPQPAHRQFAMDAIDSGADAVIGHHPHRVGGVESYKHGIIAYSLGNWWFPHSVYMDGSLRFGDETLLQLAIEWVPDGDAICHWFSYNREGHSLDYDGSDLISESKRVKLMTPFAGMAHNEYKKWFAKNRLKKKAVPMYLDYRHRFLNLLKDLYVNGRHIALVTLVKSGLRKALRV